VARVNLPSARYAEAARIREFQDRVAEALATLPGVISVGAGETTVHRRFGASKPKSGEAVTTADGKVELANGLSTNDKVERRGGRDAGKDRLKRLRNEIGLLESALKKLAKGRSSGQGWDAAEALGDKAQAILASLPAADNKKAQALLGVTLPNERRRLDRIVAETELILDERRVAETKRAAGAVYMDAGRNAGNARRRIHPFPGGARSTGDSAQLSSDRVELRPVGAGAAFSGCASALRFGERGGH